jgi:hypothetical protein
MSCTLLSFDVTPTVWTAAGAGVAGVVTAGVGAEADADVARETGTVYDTSFDGRLSAAVL